MTRMRRPAALQLISESSMASGQTLPFPGWSVWQLRRRRKRVFVQVLSLPVYTSWQPHIASATYGLDSLSAILATIFEKSNFCQKNSILTKLYNFLGKSKLSITKKCKSPTFSRVFHLKFFWQFFSWNQSCQQLKSPKPQHFHEFFTPKKLTIFSGNQSWIFGQKMKI